MRIDLKHAFDHVNKSGVFVLKMRSDRIFLFTNLICFVDVLQRGFVRNEAKVSLVLKFWKSLENFEDLVVLGDHVLVYLSFIFRW